MSGLLAPSIHSREDCSPWEVAGNPSKVLSVSVRKLYADFLKH